MSGTPATKPNSCSRPWRPCRTGSGFGPVGTKYAMDDVFWPALEELSLGAIGVEDLAARLDEDLTDRVQRFREDTGYEW